MDDQREYIRRSLIFLFRKSKGAPETHREICVVYGTNAIAESTRQHWFAKFRPGNFPCKTLPNFGRPDTI